MKIELEKNEVEALLEMLNLVPVKGIQANITFNNIIVKIHKAFSEKKVKDNKK